MKWAPRWMLIIWGIKIKMLSRLSSRLAITSQLSATLVMLLTWIQTRSEWTLLTSPASWATSPSSKETLQHFQALLAQPRVDSRTLSAVRQLLDPILEGKSTTMQRPSSLVPVRIACHSLRASSAGVIWWPSSVMSLNTRMVLFTREWVQQPCQPCP